MTCVRPPWRIELCSAKCFGLLLCLTIFWRPGWPRSHPYHSLISSNRPAVWVPAGTDGKHDYNITSMPVERRRDLLLHLAGSAVLDIFATLSDTGTIYTEALSALNTHFSPQKSLQFERHTFRQARQARNELIAQYVTRLSRLGEHCDFDKYSLDEAIKDQLVEYCHSTTLRQRLLREKPTAPLSSLLDIARSMESANFQEANIENASSQERSEKAHQLTMPTISEEEQVNSTSEKRQQCTHCNN